jgi:hypothetical protein
MSAIKGHKSANTLFELASVTLKRRQNDNDILLETNRLARRNEEIRGEQNYVRSNKLFQKIPNPSGFERSSGFDRLNNAIAIKTSQKASGTNLFGTVLTDFEYPLDDTTAQNGMLGSIPSLLDASQQISPCKATSGTTLNTTISNKSVMEFADVSFQDLWRQLRSIGWDWNFPNWYFQPGHTLKQYTRGINGFDGPVEVKRYFAENPLERLKLLESDDEFAVKVRTSVTRTSTTAVEPVATSTPTTAAAPVVTRTSTTAVEPVATSTPTTAAAPVVISTSTTAVEPVVTSTSTTTTTTASVPAATGASTIPAPLPKRVRTAVISASTTASVPAATGALTIPVPLRKRVRTAVISASTTASVPAATGALTIPVPLPKRVRNAPFNIKKPVALINDHASSSSSSNNSEGEKLDSQIISVVDSSAISFHKTITFASGDQSFAFLNEEHRADIVRNNVKLNDFMQIAMDYNDERETSRKKLYMGFMFKVTELLQSHSNILITYEDWSNCFNVIFTHILDSKIKNNSSYSEGTTKVTEFRGTQVKNQDKPALVSFFKLQKLNAESDVREIMKVLNFVLRDCSLRSSVGTNLVCKEDYSSLYCQSCPIASDFRQFIAEQETGVSENSMAILNLNELLAATEPEAILVAITYCSSYSAEKLSVCFLLKFMSEYCSLYVQCFTG